MHVLYSWEWRNKTILLLLEKQGYATIIENAVRNFR
jgi:hypothetical protein